MSKGFVELAEKMAKDDDVEVPKSNFSNFNLTGTYKYNPDRDSIYSIQYTPDGKYVMVGYGDGGVEVLDCSKGDPKLHKVLRKKIYGELPVLCIKNHPKQENAVFIASSKGVMYKNDLNDPGDKRCEEKFTEKNDKGMTNEIHTFDFHSDGTEFATGGKDLNVRLYNAETCTLVRTWEGYNMKSPTQPVNTHSQRIFCLKYLKHPKGMSELADTFVTGGWYNHIKLWDSRMSGSVKEIDGPHICGDSIDFFGYQIVTGSWVHRDSLKIFDLRYNKLLHTLPFHVEYKQEEGHKKNTGEYLYCTRFYDPDTVVAGGSGTHSVQAVSISDNKVIGEIKLCSETDKVVQAMDTHPDGKQVVFGGFGDKLCVASLS